VNVLAVDPGLTGALAIVNDHATTFRGMLIVEDMPVVAGEIDPYELTKIIVDIGPVDMVVIERVHAMPKQGVSSTFKFGRGLGVVEGVLAAFERPVTWVTPGVWTKAVAAGKSKDEHRRRAMDLYPAQAKLFRLAKHDGRADAALIGYWWLTRNERSAA
jgi:hypothetical protein